MPTNYIVLTGNALTLVNDGRERLESFTMRKQNPLEGSFYNDAYETL
jgi:hypothetical protein